MNPMQLNCCCQGTVARAGVPAQSCTAPEGTEPCACCVGAKIGKEHVLCDMFCCECCHRQVDKLELAVLSEMTNANNKLTPAQQDRLTTLTKCKADHPLQTANSRQKRISREGPEAVRATDRLKRKKHGGKALQEQKNNPNARAVQQALRRKKEANRLAKGGAPKKSTSRRLMKPSRNNRHLRCDNFLIEMLDEAIRLLVLKCGERAICWDHVTSLFDKFILKEKENIATMEIVVLNNTKGEPVIPKVLVVECERACQPHLEKKGKHLHVINDECRVSDEELHKALVERTKVGNIEILLAEIVAAVCKNRNNRNNANNTNTNNVGKS